MFDLILFHPDDKWPQISIERWRTERKYNEKDLEESVNRFMSERGESVKWLLALKAPNLELVHSGNGFRGEPLKAGDVIASWIAHDLFHIRHLSLLRWYVLNEWSGSFSPKHSGFSISQG